MSGPYPRPDRFVLPAAHPAAPRRDRGAACAPRPPALGVLILFLGWFGFNPGSTTAANGTISRIAMNTMLAACAGALGAMLTAWLKTSKPDVGMTLNGVLAGLVAITSPCATD